MKRVLKGMLALAFAAVFCMVFFAGCEDMGESSVWGGESAYSDVDVTDPIYGFIKEEDYDPETFDLENATQWTTFDVDTEYFAVINFVVTSRKDNAGQGLLNVQISFDKLDVLHGTVEDVNTGIVSELPAPDAMSGTTIKTTNLAFKIPARSAAPKEVNIIVSLKPIMVGQSHISIQFKPEEDQNKQTLFQVQGSTGLTKNLRIEPVKISMPVLAFNDALNALTWKNVKNADYYCLYEAGSPDPLTDNNGEVIYIQTGEVSVGGDMFYKISDILQGVHMLQVRAFSNNPNIQASDFSDMLQVTIW